MAIRIDQLDFAVCLKPETAISQTFNMPNRMAPEIEAGEECETAADIWSLGQIAFQLINTIEQDAFILENERHLEKLWRNGVHPDLKSLIFKMVRREPTERPTINQVL